MRLRAGQRLFLSYLLLITTLVVPISFGIESQLRSHLMSGARDELARELVLARGLVDASPGAGADSLALLLGRLSGRRATIIRPDGRVIGESSPTPVAEIGNHLERPEVQAALAGEVGWAVRRSETVGEELLYMAVPHPRLGVLRLAKPLADVDAALRGVQRGILGVSALAVLIAALLSLGFSVAIARPLQRLAGVARELAAGDLSRRVGEKRTDELGALAQALDTLADQLQRRISQLEGERAETQALIDSMAEGVIALDSGGAVRRANPAAREMFALPSEVRGLPPEAVARRPEFLGLVRRVLRGEQVPAVELVGGDGTALLATAHPLPGGGAVVVVLDVSELRRLESVRRDFVANASHELKTPLTAIRGYAETLLDEQLPEELRQRFTRVIHTNAERLQRIVDDLLDLSRIESGGWAIEAEPLQLARVVGEAWTAQAPLAEEKGIELRTELGPGAAEVTADAAALHQIFTNLFSNALRYTPPGGSVTVRATRLGPPAPAIQVEVSDTGSGIPSSHLPRIFERFYRVDPARSREEGGTGLGLAIVKHLVEAHGGRVEAASQLGSGTTIRFSIPL